MPEGKPAGVVCVNLDQETGECTVWGTDTYPAVCREFSATAELCGTNRREALERLSALEEATSPGD